MRVEAYGHRHIIHKISQAYINILYPCAYTHESGHMYTEWLHGPECALPFDSKPNCTRVRMHTRGTFCEYIFLAHFTWRRGCGGLLMWSVGRCFWVAWRWIVHLWFVRLPLCRWRIHTFVVSWWFSCGRNCMFSPMFVCWSVTCARRGIRNLVMYT
jgi:hypothetical protein